MFGSNFFAQSYFGQGYLISNVSISSAISGTSILSASLLVTESLISAIEGSSSLSVTLADNIAIISSVSGISSMTVAITDADFIVANLIGSSSMTSTVIEIPFTAYFTGSSSLTAILVDAGKILTSSWTPIPTATSGWIDAEIANLSTWLVNPQGAIDTWDDANRTWDSDYTWDGTTSQTTDAILSSWTSTEPAQSNWQKETVTTSSWSDV